MSRQVLTVPDIPNLSLQYLPLSGGQLTGNLGVGVAPAAGWNASHRVIQIGQAGTVFAQNNALGIALRDNSVSSGTTDTAIAAGPGAILTVASGYLYYHTAPSVAAGAAQTFTPRLTVAQTGTLTLTPDVGQPPLVMTMDGGGNALKFQSAFTNQMWVQNDRADGILVYNTGATGRHDWAFGPFAAGTVRMSLANNGTLTITPTAGQPMLQGPAGDADIKVGNSIYIWGGGQAGLKTNSQMVSLYPPGGGLYPGTNGQMSLGINGQAWTTVWATVGAFNGSHISLKENILPLDPGACVQALLDTQWWEFDFKPPAIPDEATDEERTITEERIAKEADSRHARGYVLGSPDHQTADLFGARDRRNQSVTSDLAVVACGLQDTIRKLNDALARIAVLEGRPAYDR